MGMYTGTTARVINADGMTEAGAIPAVVLLGDTLAPYLFIIIIDYMMTIFIENDSSCCGFTHNPEWSRRIDSLRLADAEFADDVAFITDTIEECIPEEESSLVGGTTGISLTILFTFELA